MVYRDGSIRAKLWSDEEECLHSWGCRYWCVNSSNCFSSSVALCLHRKQQILVWPQQLIRTWFEFRDGKWNICIYGLYLYRLNFPSSIQKEEKKSIKTELVINWHKRCDINFPTLDRVCSLLFQMSRTHRRLFERLWTDSSWFILAVSWWMSASSSFCVWSTCWQSRAKVVAISLGTQRAQNCAEYLFSSDTERCVQIGKIQQQKSFYIFFEKIKK